jgi:TRAP-type uncharacterized transport system substrate-binding protein
MKKSFLKGVLAIALILCIVFVPACSSSGSTPSQTPADSGSAAPSGDSSAPAASNDWPKDIVIATGNTGGTAYYIGAAQAQILSEKIPGVSFTPESTNGGAIENGIMVNENVDALGMTPIASLRDALDGVLDSYDGKMEHLRVIQAAMRRAPSLSRLQAAG